MKEKIIEFLKKHPDGCTPTQIGIGLGKSYSSASSSVNQPLKKLVADGIVTRTVRSAGVVKYTLTDKAL